MSRAIGKHLIFVVVLAVALVASFGVGLSSAASGTDIPHGGYSNGSINPMTDACLQCHDVHEATGEYVLMRENTVTGVCSTCHNIYNSDYRAGAAAYNPGYPGEEASYPLDTVVIVGGIPTSSYSSAYEIDSGQATTHEGHRLGQGRTVASGGSITYADGTVTTNGNYIPGGSYGLTRVVSWVDKLVSQYDVPAVVGDGLQEATASCDEADCSTYSPAPESLVPTGINALPNTASGTSGLYCASCHGPHGEFGNVLPESVYADGTIVGNALFASTDPLRTRGKILSSRPNHDPSNEGQVSISSYVTEAGIWCTRCHDKRAEQDLNQVQHNNHPSEFCLDCHGIYNGVTTPASIVSSDPTFPYTAEDQKDFPHTGAKNLLQAYPDELCLRCHGSGGFQVP